MIQIMAYQSLEMVPFNSASQDVSTSLCLMNNDHGAKEPRLCLVVKFLFDMRIADKDKRAPWEIIILEILMEKCLTNSAADYFLAFKTLADISRRSSGQFIIVCRTALMIHQC